MADLHRGNKRGGSRKGGALSMRKALKLARARGIDVQTKKNSGLLKLSFAGESITLSARDSEITKNTAAWLRKHGLVW